VVKMPTPKTPNTLHTFNDNMCPEEGMPGAHVPDVDLLTDNDKVAVLLPQLGTDGEGPANRGLTFPTWPEASFLKASSRLRGEFAPMQY
jgi:hypothetical protein